MCSVSTAWLGNRLTQNGHWYSSTLSASAAGLAPAAAVGGEKAELWLEVTAVGGAAAAEAAAAVGLRNTCALMKWSS